jgi:plastocyanin
VNQQDSPSEAGEPAPVEAEAEGNTSGDQLEVTAASLAFDVEELTVPADQAFTVTLQNDDAAVHNFSVYEGDSAEGALILEGQDAAANETVEESVEPLEKGSYYFQCDYHPSMNGTLTAE